MKKHAPATLRNRAAILAVLREELPDGGTILEVAAGSGEHAVFFAQALARCVWLPSDSSQEAIASIREHRREAALPNLEAPIELDASAREWAALRADAIVCINMVHISPWSATQGLMRGAAQILRGKNLPLILYGPYFERGVEPVASNVEFDEGLRQRDPEWGIRHVEDLDTLAAAHGFTRSVRCEMPANNLTLVYRTT
ncbi:MAG: DUF938 domain-containing protein [Pseudomonadota bacterium]